MSGLRILRINKSKSYNSLDDEHQPNGGVTSSPSAVSVTGRPADPSHFPQLDSIPAPSKSTNVFNKVYSKATKQQPSGRLHWNTRHGKLKGAKVYEDISENECHIITKEAKVLENLSKNDSNVNMKVAKVSKDKSDSYVKIAARNDKDITDKEEKSSSPKEADDQKIRINNLESFFHKFKHSVENKATDKQTKETRGKFRDKLKSKFSVDSNMNKFQNNIDQGSETHNCENKTGARTEKVERSKSDLLHALKLKISPESIRKIKNHDAQNYQLCKKDQNLPNLVATGSIKNQLIDLDIESRSVNEENVMESPNIQVKILDPDQLQFQQPIGKPSSPNLQIKQNNCPVASTNEVNFIHDIEHDILGDEPQMKKKKNNLSKSFNLNFHLSNRFHKRMPNRVKLSNPSTRNEVVNSDLESAGSQSESCSDNEEINEDRIEKPVLQLTTGASEMSSLSSSQSDLGLASVPKLYFSGVDNFFQTPTEEDWQNSFKSTLDANRTEELQNKYIESNGKVSEGKKKSHKISSNNGPIHPKTIKPLKKIKNRITNKNNQQNTNKFQAHIPRQIDDDDAIDDSDIGSEVLTSEPTKSTSKDDNRKQSDKDSKNLSKMRRVLSTLSPKKSSGELKQYSDCADVTKDSYFDLEKNETLDDNCATKSLSPTESLTFDDIGSRHFKNHNLDPFALKPQNNAINNQLALEPKNNAINAQISSADYNYEVHNLCINDFESDPFSSDYIKPHANEDNFYQFDPFEVKPLDEQSFSSKSFESSNASLPKTGHNLDPFHFVPPLSIWKKSDDCDQCDFVTADSSHALKSSTSMSHITYPNSNNFSQSFRSSSSTFIDNEKAINAFFDTNKDQFNKRSPTETPVSQDISRMLFKEDLKPREKQLQSDCINSKSSTRKKLSNYLSPRTNHLSPRENFSRNAKLSFSSSNLTQLMKLNHGNPHIKLSTGKNDVAMAGSMVDCSHWEGYSDDDEDFESMWDRLNTSEGDNQTCDPMGDYLHQRQDKIRRVKKMSAFEHSTSQLMLG